MSLNEDLKQIKRRLKGKHALFSPSQPSWINDNEDEFVERLKNNYRTELGTIIHEWSSIQIRLGHKYKSVREIRKDIETFIFSKYDDPTYGITHTGLMLLMSLNYIPSEIYGTVKSFVNDAVSLKMDSEEVLYFSDNFFGTADAIKLDDNILRIHDLKTGSRKAKMEQLDIYAALFCLENNIKPSTIQFENRIYQGDEVFMSEPSPEMIMDICKKIRELDKIASHYTNTNKEGRYL